MRILMWHVHGSWTTAFVQSKHHIVLPVLPGRGPDGRGRARTWNWPPTVVERTPAELQDEPLDLIVLQRAHEIELLRRWTGLRVGVDLPAVYVEHNAPEPHPVNSSHPLAHRDDIPLVHVTNFNRLFWDNGIAPTTVIEHGLVDPGYQYTGEYPRAAVVINEPERRGRMVGADILAQFGADSPLDLFGMQDLRVTPGVHQLGDLSQHRMHAELARRRVYLHPFRWTSLGLSLLEAMLLGLPVVAVASTEVVEAVPSAAGVVSTDLERLRAAVRTYAADPEASLLAGRFAREYALHRYGLDRFLLRWNRLLAEVMGNCFGGSP